MRKWLILLSALSAITAQAAPAWTWTDQNGQVHFSDRPEPGARQIELAGAQGFNAPAAQRGTTAPAGPQTAGPALYRTINILSPADQETFSNNGGNVTVRVGFEPPLQPGHRYDLALDGQRLNRVSATPQMALTNVTRGEHTLQVVVLDTTGTELMRSPSRTFFVQQVSLQNPNSPLGRRPAANNNGN
jgi:hypothetical protein